MTAPTPADEKHEAMWKPCAGCGQPTTGMCWTDCGMAMCGAPLCGSCCHIDEKYGWRHEPRDPAAIIASLTESDR